MDFLFVFLLEKHILTIMLDFQQKRKVRKIVYHRLTLLVLAILVLFSLRSLYLVYQKQGESEVLKENAKRQTAELQVRENDLRTRMERLQTTLGVEAEIRSKFSVAKQNENMVVVFDSTTSTSPDKVDGSWWDRLLRLLHFKKSF